MLKTVMTTIVVCVAISGCSTTPTASTLASDGYILKSEKPIHHGKPPGAFRKLCTFVKGTDSVTITTHRAASCDKA